MIRLPIILMTMMDAMLNVTTIAALLIIFYRFTAAGL